MQLTLADAGLERTDLVGKLETGATKSPPSNNPNW